MPPPFVQAVPAKGRIQPPGQVAPLRDHREEREAPLPAVERPPPCVSPPNRSSTMHLPFAGSQAWCADPTRRSKRISRASNCCAAVVSRPPRPLSSSRWPWTRRSRWPTTGWLRLDGGQTETSRPASRRRERCATPARRRAGRGWSSRASWRGSTAISTGPSARRRPRRRTPRSSPQRRSSEDGPRTGEATGPPRRS